MAAYSFVTTCHCASEGVRVRYQIKTLDSKPLDFFQFNVITDHVTNLAKYGRKKSETLVFEIKICVQAKLFLANSEIMADSTLRYEILIGGWGNKITALRRSDGNDTNNVSEKFNIDGLLDCNQYRLLWASWEDETLTLGTGGILGQNVQCSWTDPNSFEVKSAGIYSRNYDGDWKIEIDVADESTGFFSNCNRNDNKASLMNLKVVFTEKVQCIAICAKMTDCVGINYSSQMSRCELLSFDPGLVSAIPQSLSAGWTYYTKCFRDKEVCIGCFF
ncbi:uncharacterized protein LOC134692571 [Mytilus trossulus]|uniref:uncharacterized protein LOC134692571 n=1 Tax=Mytilus trossulus TaxID=6551 RepID=UPI0030073FA4